jgi:hypothetical protein
VTQRLLLVRRHAANDEHLELGLTWPGRWPCPPAGLLVPSGGHAGAVRVLRQGPGDASGELAKLVVLALAEQIAQFQKLPPAWEGPVVPDRIEQAEEVLGPLRKPIPSASPAAFCRRPVASARELQASARSCPTLL